ncbi:MAG TPA: GIY-YIG nuclease family protein, partial [Candidatus Saccharimonadales bacterium]
MHYLYKISDTLNNKVYIGQSKDPEKRWKQHKWLSNKIIKHQYIHRAIAKYGIDNFTFEVIATCISQEDADETEIILIKQYDSRNIEKGYNLGAGGNTNIPGEETRKKMSISAKQRIINYPNTNPGIFDNPAPSKETIEKIRLANLGRIQSQEEKNKRTQSLLKHYETHESPLIGKTSHMKGKQHTEETKQKITENLTGYKHTEKAKSNMS